ncbi:hypothetical protein BDV40DRAFT_57697 [Aspergillus tamarii]|uniref:Uncharacterized protein n=1 Tax=Aspergillus tamarii TaxID=41984 RepID=A0A5N6V3S4_ASPTM|nr:hypothetical protein BDV40DRAFT_57697 [Aspergillus tamarii]
MTGVAYIAFVACQVILSYSSLCRINPEFSFLVLFAKQYILVAVMFNQKKPGRLVMMQWYLLICPQNVY